MPDLTVPKTAVATVAYETLARFYDGFEGDRGRQVCYLRGLIETHSPQAITLLELGCGTGALLQLLHPRYEVTGIDGSEAMLKAAPPGLRKRLLQADITNFHLDRHFDVVLCAYDTINHLPEFAAWEALFDQVAAHVCEGGLFLFDMNTARRLRELALSPPTVRWFGDENLFIVDVQETASADDTLTTRWTIDVFERAGGSYCRHSAVIDEVAFDTARVRKALDARFRTVSAYDQAHALRVLILTSRLRFSADLRRLGASKPRMAA